MSDNDKIKEACKAQATVIWHNMHIILNLKQEVKCWKEEFVKLEMQNSDLKYENANLKRKNQNRHNSSLLTTS